jgi:hypothetical protein
LKCLDWPQPWPLIWAPNMRITKSQLRQLIKEELKVVLTNEEAGELFGEEIEALLNELDEDESKGTSQ